MAKRSEEELDWELRKASIVGLGERSVRKNYYPQLRQNMERLQRFHTLLDYTSDFVVLISMPDGLISDANAAFAQLLGVNVDDIIGQPFNGQSFCEDCQQVIDLLHRDMVVSHKHFSNRNHSLVSQSGDDSRPKWLELSFKIASVDRQCYGVLVGRDVTERKRNEALMNKLLSEKAALLDNALVGIASVRNRFFESCNRRFEEMLGYPPGKLQGQSTRIMYQEDDTYTALGDAAYRSMKHGQKYTARVMLRRADSSEFLCEITGQLNDPSHPELGSIWMFNDVNELKLAEDKALFLSHHDALTKLPNYQLLKDRLSQAISLASLSGKQVALVVIDIDRFKTINDSLGYGVGNQVLVQVAERILNEISDVDTVSRQGGDEFLLLLPAESLADERLPIISRLMAKLAEPYFVADTELRLSVSVGIALSPEDGDEFEILLKKADMAMYRAKSEGRDTYRFFNAEMSYEATEQLNIRVGLRKALELNQFQLFYQPQLDINSGRLVGAEALIRWFHPELGMVSPAHFIPVAEASGLIVAIGDWVLQEACREVARWRDAGMPNPVVAVNLSALQFARGNIEQAVSNAVADAGILPQMLELELTESIMIRNTERVLATVKRLKQKGFVFTIDDFGTGYSSLQYLKRFEVDKLKIDQSFVRDIIDDEDDAAIVRAIVQIAKGLGLKTIAEGVETTEIMALLQQYQCDEVQGYYLARPMSASQFMTYLQQHC
ncbi:bifunctional diguanylate cyclase/phosphodiesterase [Shewanella fodinae]|uniref:cyclic-guanylate-specific phosphodiesterase n=1 Tax=Shewanella fodinae TaxID=552357 RepID=A0A4R2F068_9GAMM|nr:bifunctional diguanylate cyclase/phosphodiesterase [Shewanella fodinae]TCN76968.1 PAS domain S-box-containing protein/diguanylate cyclase (GGDEF)-like protein [Shewanella fodinae]